MDNKLNIAYKQIDYYKLIYKIKKIKEERRIIFLCVGSSKVWYDSFGPIVGSLFKLLNFEVYIYGNTKSNITANNIKEYIDIIYKFHNNPYIVVFDNAITLDNEPSMKIKEGSVTCAFMSKNKYNIGDLSITYCFNKNNIKEIKHYSKMLSEIKNIVRLFLFLFK